MREYGVWNPFQDPVYSANTSSNENSQLLPLACCKTDINHMNCGPGKAYVLQYNCYLSKPQQLEILEFSWKQLASLQR